MSDPLNPFGNSPHSAFDPSSSVSQPTTQSQQYPTGGTGNGWGGETRSGMVPRGARTVDERRRTETDEDDYGVRPGGGEASTATPSRPPAAAQEGFVRIRILGIDRNRRDMYIKFNAESNLPTFRNATYRAISRSYTEFTGYVSALSVTCPQSIIPALPLPQTSAATDEEDDRILKQQYQKWVVRLMQDQAVVRDEETRNFVESDFGYTPHHKKKSTTSFPSFSRGSKGGELDDPLTLSKISMARLETTFLDASKTVEKLSKSRRQTATAVNELGDQINTYAISETYTPLANGFKRLARGMKVDADILAVQSINELVHLSDALLYQSSNARSAKETLSNRDSVSEEHRAAVKLTIQKRRNIEKLRSSAKELRSDKVDEALEELDEAKRHELLLTNRLTAISSSLSPSLARHSVQTHSDLLSTLLDHAKSNLVYEKQRLKEYETLRSEMKNIRKLEGGVVYHHHHEQSRTAGSPRTAANSVTHSPSIAQRTSSAMSPSPSTSSVNSATSRPPQSTDPLSSSTGPTPNSRDLGSMAQKAQKRTVRSMASSVVVEGDRRQRVDARMAASMLANGF
ncbi:retromer subunit VPS17 [Sporobolomyces salmoneus]|uniref:retromer subunit VPS17 n=1 Tax=Sporobolomyces salmoneus TaxID=183962 RepID=UPI0031740C97